MASARTALRILLALLVFQLAALLQETSAVESLTDGGESSVSSSAVAAASSSNPESTQPVCTLKGRVYTQRKWYGYLVHKTFRQSFARIQYQITYPVRECCTNLLIYYDDQVKDLQSGMTCQERQDVLPNDNNQVIPLRESNDGCSIWDEKGESFYVCRGERIFRSRLSRSWFFALSRCDEQDPDTKPLNLNYVFNITGYYGECEEDPLSPSSGWSSYVGHLGHKSRSASDQNVYKYLSISLGIVAGLALILAAVFFGLWFLGLRNAAKGKGSSVTSSQATMTQDDIFYVNPSLSDQGHQEYSQSGSENYYEVIPERRSYESINTGLANGGIHLKPMRGSLGHHPHHGGMGLGVGVGHHHHLHHPLHPHHAVGGHHPHHGIHHPHPLNMAALGHAGGNGGGGNNNNNNNNGLGGGSAGNGGQAGGLGVGGLHHTAGRPTQVKDLGQNVRGVTYMFDYPPPPYQPPKLGMGKSPSGGAGIPISAGNAINPNNVLIGANVSGGPSTGNIASSAAPSAQMQHQHHHQHTLSLPANHQRQQQRQHFANGPPPTHHAYHSSIVPTSAALGLSSDDPIIIGGGNKPSTSNSGINNINNPASTNAMMGLNSNLPASSTTAGSAMSAMTEVGGYRPDTVPITTGGNSGGIGGLSLSNGGQGLNLGTFGMSSSSAALPSNGGIGIGGINSNVGGGGGIGHNPASSAMSMSLNPASSASQVPPPAPNGGQCETSA